MGDCGPQQPGVDQVAEHLQGAVVRSEEGPPPGQPAAGPRVVGEEGGQARHGARHQAQPDRGHQVGNSLGVTVTNLSVLASTGLVRDTQLPPRRSSEDTGTWRSMVSTPRPAASSTMSTCTTEMCHCCAGK